MILINYLVGFIEDNVGFFSLPRLIGHGLAGCTEYYGYPTGFCQNLLLNNQPLAYIPIYLLAKIIDPVMASNIITLGGLTLTLIFSFKFFAKLFGRFTAALLAITFLASPYFGYQSRAHFDLIQFWPVIWFLDTLFFSKSRFKAEFLGLLLTLITGFSNYLGYFTVIFFGLYTGVLTSRLVVTLLARRIIKSATLVKIGIRSLSSNIVRANAVSREPDSGQARMTIWRETRDVLATLAIFILSTSIFLLPYIKANYFAPRVRMEENTNDKALNRPYEDFMTFSSRPWYYLMPSVDNPFFGPASQRFLDIVSQGGNYLTQNYFKAEHSASFLGWINVVLAGVGIGILLSKQRKRIQMLKQVQHDGRGKQDDNNNVILGNVVTPESDSGCVPPCGTYQNDANTLAINYPALLLTIAGLIILTMPPSITINGAAIYLPGYVLFKFFPMFRVLARAGVLILFLTLIFTGYGYVALKRKVGYSIVIFLTLFSIAIFFIPIKLTHVTTPPKVFSYLGQNDVLKAPIVVYPYEKTDLAFFWMSTYNKPLINPKSYEYKETGFVSEDFTNQLNTLNGLAKARLLGAKYLVYFYKIDAGTNIDLFNSSNYLVRVGEFVETGSEETDYTFVRIIEAGAAKSNSAILYKFR